MRIRTRAIVMTAFILAFSMMSVPGLIGFQRGFGVAQGQPSRLYPVNITLGTGEKILIATHTSSKIDGNWIELFGVTPIMLPSIALVYSGPDSAIYTQDGVTITIESIFQDGQATYPIATHQVYSTGQPISTIFWGAQALQGETIDFKLLKLTSLLEIREILNETFRGNLTPLLNNLSSPTWSTTKTLDGGGDIIVDIPSQTVGDYLLVAVKEITSPSYELYIYSATAIEVVDYNLAVFAPSSVKQGELVDITVNLLAAPQSFYIYGFAMIEESAYSGEVILSTDGTIIGTELYLNGVLMANGTFAIGFVNGTKDQSDLTKEFIIAQLMKAFSSSELAFGFAITMSTTGSISLSTSSLTPGNYILLVGVLKDWGSKIVGVHQTTVTVLPSGIPVAHAGGPYTGKPGAAITFDGSGSYDIDGYIVSYAWTFGDGETGIGVSPSHTYTADGTYNVKLTVTDNASQTAFATTTATISTPTKPPPGPPPYIPPINQPPVAEAGPNRTVYVDKLIHFSGSESYDPDGTIIFYKWELGDGEIAYGENVSHTYQEPGSYTANLTVTDNGNSQGSDTCTITVKEIPPIIIPPLPPFLSDLNIAPTEVELGDEVTISLGIMNPNNQSITYIVTIKIGELTLLIDVELEAYESKTVSRTITRSSVGDFNVTIDGMTGSFTVKTPPLKPAEFVASDLTITPEEVGLGEEVEISFTVTNIGELPGDYAFTIGIEGPLLTGSVEVTGYLEAGKSHRTSYMLGTNVPGTYNVEVDDLTGSFTMKELKPAEFEISNLVVTPQEVEPEASVTVSATITNVGDEAGGLIIEFKLDGSVAEMKTVDLNGGESETVTFTTSSEEEGSHSVEIDGLSGSFTVEAPPKDNLLFWFAIVVVLVAIALYMIWKKTDWIDQLRARLK